MGNQPGANPYQSYQPQGSQIAQHNIPYANTPPSGVIPSMTPSAISNYHQQGFAPNKWPSYTNLQQQNQSNMQNVGPSSNINDLTANNNFNGSQAGQIRGSQLQGNPSGINYNNNPGYNGSYIDQLNMNPSGINSNPGQQNTYGYQQRTSNISQQPQMPWPQQTSQIPSSQSHLQAQQQLQQPGSQIFPQQTSTLSNVVPSSGISQHEHSQIPKPTSAIKRPPSILQSKNDHPGHSSILRTNRSSSRQRKVRFPDQRPRTNELVLANLKLTKQKLDKLASDNEQELYNIMEQIQTEVNQGILSRERLIYLLKIKKNYQRNIIAFRMKQQKLGKVAHDFNTTQSEDTSKILAQMNRQIDSKKQQYNSGWREASESESHPMFRHELEAGLNDVQVMNIFETYNRQVQAAISNLPPETSTSSVMTLISPNATTVSPTSTYDYNGYTGNLIQPTSSMSLNPVAQSVNTIASTARFARGDNIQMSTNSFGPNSTIRSLNDNQYGLNVISASEIHVTPIFPLSPPSITEQSNLKKRPSDVPGHLQPPKIADFLQSKVTPPPPQFQPFVPPIPPTSYFTR